MSAAPSGSIEFLPTVRRLHHGVGVLTQALMQELKAASAARPCAVLARALQGSATAQALAELFGAESLYFGAFEHVPPAAVLQVAGWLRERNADFVVAVGGGSAIDTAKAARFVLAAGLEQPDALLPAMEAATPAGTWLAQVSVPTTLSGAEYTRSFSVTDLGARRKRSHTASACASTAIVYDPTATLHTPKPLWLGSGFVALDHALEVFVTSAPHPVADALKGEAAATLFAKLPESASTDALEARLACQLAGWMVDHSPLRAKASGASGQPWSHLLAYELAAIARLSYTEAAVLTLASSLRVLGQDPRCAGRQDELARRLGSTRTLSGLVDELAIRLELERPRVPDEVLREAASACAARTGASATGCAAVLGLAPPRG